MAKTYNIAALGGDGTGPEVLVEGIKVLNAVAPKFDVNRSSGCKTWNS